MIILKILLIIVIFQLLAGHIKTIKSNFITNKRVTIEIHGLIWMILLHKPFFKRLVEDLKPQT
jgi:hypothetical protein